MDKVLEFALGPFGKGLAILVALAALVWGVRGYLSHVERTAYKAGQAEVQGRWDSEKEVQQRVALARNAEFQARHEAIVGAMGTAVDQLTKENTDAKVESARLRADLAAGKLRWSVPVASCPGGGGTAQAASGAGGGDAGPRAELPPEVAADLLAIGDDADDAVRQLTACQAILRAERQ